VTEWWSDGLRPNTPVFHYCNIPFFRAPCSKIFLSSLKITVQPAKRTASLGRARINLSDRLARCGTFVQHVNSDVPRFL
jgi:hypothetical protein